MSVSGDSSDAGSVSFRKAAQPARYRNRDPQGADQGLKFAASTQPFSRRSAKGAECNSLGQRPRLTPAMYEALKARNNAQSSSHLRLNIHCALSALRNFVVSAPGPLAQAVTFRAVGAGNSRPWRQETQSTYTLQSLLPLNSKMHYQQRAKGNLCLASRKVLFVVRLAA